MYIEEEYVKKWPSLCEVTIGTLVTFVNLSLFDVSNSCSLYVFFLAKPTLQLMLGELKIVHDE